MPDSLDRALSPEGETPREKARREALAGIEAMREAVRQGRALPSRPEGENPDWDLHERRLDELAEIIRTGNRPEDVARFETLEEIFTLDWNADLARATAGIFARQVRSIDEIAARVEEKKFELPSTARDELEEMLLPFQEQYREEMLGQIPIATRREIEDEAKRRRDGGGPG